MSTYQWSTFNLASSLSGVLVGIQNVGADEDISLTGKLERYSDDPSYPFRVSLNGTLCYCTNTGLTYCPTDNTLNNVQLKNVKVVLDQTTDNVMTRSGGNRTISSANPRDEFAMEVLNAIIQKQDNPQAFDDGSMLRTAQLAYRWANAMMEAAADNRYDDTQASTQGGSTGDVANAINAKGTATTPLVTAVKNVDNTQLVVKGNDTYSPDDNPSNDIAGVLNVNVVAGGGGGGGGTVEVDTMPALTGTFNIGNTSSTPLYISTNKDAATLVTATERIEYLAAFLYDAYGKSLVKVKLGDVGVPILTEISAFPTASNVEKGHYYRYTSSFSDNNALTSVAINLPAVSSPLSGVVNIVIFNFKCAASSAFSITVPSGTTVKYRGSNPGSSLAAGTYEIDCVDNGLYWTIGVTAIIDS